MTLGQNTVRDGKYDLTDKKRDEVLALLQEEITAACNCQNEELYPLDKHELSCDENKTQDKVESISIIYECEKTLLNYVPIVSLTSM